MNLKPKNNDINAEDNGAFFNKRKSTPAIEREIAPKGMVLYG